MNKDKQIEHITKRYPILENVPKEERLNVFKRSKTSPFFWGTLSVLLIIWIYFFGWEIMQLSGNLFDPNDKGLIMKFISVIKKTFWPALVPSMIILVTVWKVQAYIIKKIVTKEYIK
ncbi:MAG: hypothetical protein ABJD66_15575 [Cellulophaga sp.]|uniref:hypothetical protein n=1 Tax=Cellulophaga sp. TaxID=1972202 RepID=UPI003267E5B1